MVLFRASQHETQYLNAGRTLGWGEFIRGPILVREVAGSHFSMMAEPGISQLIEELRRVLAADGGPTDRARRAVAV